MLRLAIESHGLHVAGKFTFGLQPSDVFWKDLFANRGHAALTASDVRAETETLRLKESPLQYARWLPSE